MKNNWINFAPYQSNISKTLDRLDASGTDEVLLDLSKELITMLRSTQATGAFVVLLAEGESLETNDKSYPALYFRDYDPQSNAYAYDDIYVISGPAAIAQVYKMPLDTVWQPSLPLSERYFDFVKKPHGVGQSVTQAPYMGYWSPPFKLNPNDLEIITYSLPLHDSKGTLRGVIGVELTLNYLVQFLPAFELQAQDSLGYLIAYRPQPGAPLEPIVMGGALQRRMIDANGPLNLSLQNADLNIYTIEAHFGTETLYAAKERIGLYAHNTPFEGESWHLVGIMREGYLLSYVNRIEQILISTLLVALLVGGIGGLSISFNIAKPITRLSNQVHANKAGKSFVLSKTGLMELDVLSESIVSANEEMMASASRLTRIIDMFDLSIAAFEMDHRRQVVHISGQLLEVLGVKDPEEAGVMTMAYEPFKAMVLKRLNEGSEVEPHVYKLDTEPPRWVRFKMTASEQTTLGILVDVTDEILEKTEIIRERDHDPLTQLLNRKGFQWTFEAWYPSRDIKKTSALVMLDLDNLKTINDAYGHRTGDTYIKEAVRLFRSIEQAHGDSRCVIGRRSGDEFVIAFLDFESESVVLSHLDALFERLKTTPIHLTKEVERCVSVSGGLMWIEAANDLSYEELLHYADEALYHAKQKSKGHYQIGGRFL